MLGVWMWPMSVLLRGALKTVNWCARAGVTDIFFLVKGRAGSVAYCSAYAPVVSERDLLRELIDAAHRQGIRVHAWFTSACDAHYKQLHPESGRCHFQRGKDKGLISLVDEGYLSYMEKVIGETFASYEVDGLHLDYIRYNHMLYGWAEEDVKRYAAEGADTAHLQALMQRMLSCEHGEKLLLDACNAGDESVLAFARTRRKDVVQFAERMIAAAQSQNSGLMLSAALMPEGSYDDTAYADLHYGQNYEDAAKLYEYALPMAYSQAYNEDGQWVKRVAEGTMKRGLKTIVGVHAYEGGTGGTLQADLEALKETPVEGICLFREGATAFALAEEKSLCLCNALEEEITGVSVRAGDENILLDKRIASGEEACFRLPFCAESVRVFTGEKESCVYLTRNI